MHGDDFVSEGELSSLGWLDAELKKRFELKTEVMGAQQGLEKDLRLLNRIIRWTDEGVT